MDNADAVYLFPHTAIGIVLTDGCAETAPLHSGICFINVVIISEVMTVMWHIQNHPLFLCKPPLLSNAISQYAASKQT